MKFHYRVHNKQATDGQSKLSRRPRISKVPTQESPRKWSYSKRTVNVLTAHSLHHGKIKRKLMNISWWHGYLPPPPLFHTLPRTTPSLQPFRIILPRRLRKSVGQDEKLTDFFSVSEILYILIAVPH